MILLFLPEPQGSPPALGSATYPMGKHTQHHPVEARLPKQAPKIQSLRHYQPPCHVPAHAREACRTVSTTARPELCPTGFYSRPLNQAHGQRREFRSPLSSCLLFPQKDQAAPLWVFGELQHRHRPRKGTQLCSLQWAGQGGTTQTSRAHTACTQQPRGPKSQGAYATLRYPRVHASREAQLSRALAGNRRRLLFGLLSFSSHYPPQWDFSCLRVLGK